VTGLGEAIADRLGRHRAELGIDRYVVREAAMPAVRQIMAVIDGA
jgi:hypothetical protein